MRHGNTGSSLNRTSSHRTAMFRNLSKSLINNERIITTLPKAKLLRIFFEPLVTLAKKGDEASRRLAVSRLANSKHTELMVEKLFNDLAKRYKNRNGGYTRIIKTGFRRGDTAPMALVELMDRNKDIHKNRVAKRKKKEDLASERSKTE